MEKWFQPLFENDGGAGGSAGSDGPFGTDDNQGDSTNAGGNQGAGTGGAELTWLKAGELRDAIAALGIKQPTELAEKFKEQATELSGLKKEMETAIIPPADDATEEEKAAYLERIGVPKTPEEYELDRSELPEGVSYDEAFETWFRETAKAAGLNKTQAKKVFEGYTKRIVENRKAATEARKQASAKTRQRLVEKHGQEEAEAILARAKKAVRLLGTTEFDRFLDETGLSSDPRMIEYQARIGEIISDDVIAQGGAGFKNRPTDPNDPDSWDFPGLE